MVSTQGLGLSQQASYHRIVHVSRFSSATISLKCRPPIYRVWFHMPIIRRPCSWITIKTQTTPLLLPQLSFSRAPTKSAHRFFSQGSLTHNLDPTKPASRATFICDPRGFSLLYCNFGYALKYIYLILLYILVFLLEGFSDYLVHLLSNYPPKYYVQSSGFIFRNQSYYVI